MYQNSPTAALFKGVGQRRSSNRALPGSDLYLPKGAASPRPNKERNNSEQDRLFTPQRPVWVLTGKHRTDFGTNVVSFSTGRSRQQV